MSSKDRSILTLSLTGGGGGTDILGGPKFKEVIGGSFPSLELVTVVGLKFGGALVRGGGLEEEILLISLSCFSSIFVEITGVSFLSSTFSKSESKS